MSEDKVLEEIIIGYRKVIKERYELENLNKFYNLPDSIDESVVREIKNYFLDYVYPDIERRNELNEAFKTLDDFIKKPEKLLSVLAESVKLVFKYGRSLPKISGAGLKAMKSFRAATAFEEALVDAAIEKKRKPPFTAKKINNLITELSREEIDDFIESTESLFAIMHNKTLVKKIQEVISYLIHQMNKKKVFTKNDVRGLEVGLEMIQKGEELLNTLSDENQKILIQFIVKVERDNLEKIFN